MKKDCELSLIVHGKFDEDRVREISRHAADYRGSRAVKTCVRLLMEAFLTTTASEDVRFELRRGSE